MSEGGTIQIGAAILDVAADIQNLSSQMNEAKEKFNQGMDMIRSNYVGTPARGFMVGAAGKAV